MQPLPGPAAASETLATAPLVAGAQAHAAPASLRFGADGRFELQTHARCLLVAGRPAPLGSRAFDLLLALCQRPGQVLTKAALLDLVWPGVVVQENNLAAQISALRKVLGSALIATVAGRGYCFTGRTDLAAAGDAAGDAAAAAALATAPTHLPDSPTPLIGRDDHLAVLEVLIRRHRLVCLVGAGGIGKTRLAQALVHGQRSAWPHGVCWVELATVKDAAALPEVIAAALGLRTGAGEPLASLCVAMAPLQLMVALDNAEHLLDGVARVARALLDQVPGLRLVVTSQAPLRLAAERVFRLDALAVPPGHLPAAQAFCFGAVELFRARARAVDPEFELTDANAAAVIDLCRALDGLPLAIELAAARLPLLGLARLAQSMQHRLQLLTRNPDRVAPGRQQTLRAALAWSHDLLDGTRQTVLRRLGVMAGSASLAFIQAVLVDPPAAGPPMPGAIDEWQVLEALGELVEHSLVTVLNDVDDVEGAERRYRLLESTRQFALEQLQSAGEYAALRSRHALALAAQFDQQWTERSSGNVGLAAWERQVQADAANAGAAIAWATQAGLPDAALTIASTWLLALPRSLYTDRQALADSCETLLATPLPPRLRQRAALVLARTWINSRRPHAFAAAGQALVLARALDADAPDRWRLYRALCHWVETGSALADTDSAALAAALAELQALENPAWPAIRLYAGLGALQLWLARPDNSASQPAHYLSATRRIVTMAGEAGDNPASQMSNLMDAELCAGNAQAAIRTGQALLASLEGSRDLHSLTFARLNLGAALLVVDDTVRAAAVLQAGWQRARTANYHPYYADYLALLAALQGRPEAAAQLVGFADAANRAIGGPREHNEAAAINRARLLAAAALGQPSVLQLQAEGETLRDSQVAMLAFGVSGRP